MTKKTQITVRRNVHAARGILDPGPCCPEPYQAAPGTTARRGSTLQLVLTARPAPVVPATPKPRLPVRWWRKRSRSAPTHASVAAEPDVARWAPAI